MSAIRLHDMDNVAIVKCAKKAGDIIDAAFPIGLQAAIPAMHKVALTDIDEGSAIKRYGQTIGFAISDIAAGDHVHNHNCSTGVQDEDYAFCTETIEQVYVPAEEQRTFMGYKRASGKVGTRNYIGIITSVNCSATVARYIADAFNRTDILKDYPNIGGVVPLVHNTGCGMSNQGEGYDMINRVVQGYATHPNFGGVMLVGLGCEIMQVAGIMERGGFKDSKAFKHFIIQDEGGSAKTVERGIEAIKDMLPVVNEFKREPVPVSEITLALQCGGSDAYSGMTANPALGKAVDLLVAEGGTAILSETPEIYGAEHMLTRRATSRKVGEALLERIAWWKDYAAKHGDAIDNNPSPGNKAGGLTTILEKSLGAQAKGGSTSLNAVYRYAEPVTERGLVIVDSPGYDPMSVTGQVASGATVVCFTTGRGSAFGFKPSPTIKLATNNALYERQKGDMDINCGPVAEGELTLDQMGEIILEKVIAVASGEQSKSEAFGYGDNEFLPWQIHANL